jgi:alkyl hydroperoxide reductase subunit D
MSLQSFADSLPGYAGDLRQNVEALLRDETLVDQRKYGVILACAHGTGYKPLVLAAEAEAAGRLSPQAAEAARAAAALMAMNNVYYRFVHLVSNPDYATLPSRLRMNTLGGHGIDKDDFELFSLALSAMNGCGLCIDSHEQALRKHGVPMQTIQAAARTAAILKAVATVHAAL